MPLWRRSKRERHPDGRRRAHFLDQIVAAARTALAPLLAGRSQRCEFAPSTPAVEALADAAKSLQVISAMLEQASAVAPPRSVIEVRAAAASRVRRSTCVFPSKRQTQ